MKRSLRLWLGVATAALGALVAVGSIVAISNMGMYDRSTDEETTLFVSFGIIGVGVLLLLSLTRLPMRRLISSIAIGLVAGALSFTIANRPKDDTANGVMVVVGLAVSVLSFMLLPEKWIRREPPKP